MQPEIGKSIDLAIRGGGGKEIVILTILALAYLLGEELMDTNTADSLNILGPIVGACALGYGAWKTAIAHPSGTLSALFWLRISTAIFYCIGNVIPFFLNETTQKVFYSFYHPLPEEVTKVNLITTLGVITILLAKDAMGYFIRPSMLETGGRSAQHMLTWGILTGAVGTIIKYLIVLPYSLGIVTVPIPGFIIQLSSLTSVGIFLVGAWAMPNSRPIFLGVVAFTALDMTVGLLTFSKTEVLFSLIMLAFAVLGQGITTSRTIAVAGACVAVFMLIAPVVDYGRDAVMAKYNSIVGAGLIERVQIVQRYFAGGKAERAVDVYHSEYQGGLARLSYTNQSAFAVHLFDSGIQGDSIEAIAVVLIPRFLWPDKPNLNYLGLDFTMRATGSVNLTWPGRYTEVYWNWGWWGIPLLLAPLGIIYGYLSWYTAWVFATNRWAYFPVVLLGMKYGIDISGPYATSGVGGLIYIIILHMGCAVGERLMDAFDMRHPSNPVLHPGRNRNRSHFDK